VVSEAPQTRNIFVHSKLRLMTKLKQKADYTGQNIYVGIDVHLRTWDVALRFDKQHLRSFHQSSDTGQLVSTLQRDYPNATFHCAYEAGFSGFWLQRQLTQAGMSCIVVNAADVPQTDKGRRVKNDQSDAKRIAGALEAGQLTGIYVPDTLTVSHRKSVRYRQQLSKDFKRNKVRIKHFLYDEGIKIPSPYSKNNWSKNFIEWLKNIEHEHESSRQTLSRMIAQLEAQKQEIAYTTKQIYQMLESDLYKDTAALLMSVPGIGKLTCATLLVEIADIHRFSNFVQFNSFIGFCPGEHSSGEEERKTHIITRHHKTLRSLMIEAAWVAVRADPAITLAFSELKKKMTAKRAIIRIARKLLNRIYHVWTKSEAYENGIVN